MKHLIIALMMLGAVIDSSQAGCLFGPSQQSLDKALIAAAKISDPLAVQALINEGANVNAKDKKGRFPLCSAINAKQEDNALILLNAKAKANENCSGFSLLHQAVDNGLVAVTEALLKIETIKRKINERDQLGRTPLIAAILSEFQSEAFEIVSLLIANGASIKITHKDGMSPLTYSIFTDKQDIQECLVENGANKAEADTQIAAYHEKNRQFRIAEAKKSSGPSGSGSASHSSSPASEALRAAKILKNGYDLGTFIGQVLQ